MAREEPDPEALGLMAEPCEEFQETGGAIRQAQEADPEVQRRRERLATLLNARLARLCRGGPEMGRQEDLLLDARAWAATALREITSEVQDVAELKERVVKQTWDNFVPTHRYHSDVQLGYREFTSALWDEGWPSLEDRAITSIQERAASAASQAGAVVTRSSVARGEDSAVLETTRSQGIAKGAMNQLPDLPPQFQNAFEAAKAKAELEYATRAQRFPHHPQFADDPLHRLLLIQKVFFASCTEARNACREGDWTAAQVSRWVDSEWPRICDSYFAREHPAGSEAEKLRFRNALWQTIPNDQQWKQHLSDLAALAQRASAAGAAPPNPEGAGNNREVPKSTQPGIETVASLKSQAADHEPASPTAPESCHQPITSHISPALQSAHDVIARSTVGIGLQQIQDALQANADVAARAFAEAVRQMEEAPSLIVDTVPSTRAVNDSHPGAVSDSGSEPKPAQDGTPLGNPSWEKAWKRVPLSDELKNAEARTADLKLQKRLTAVVRYTHYFDDLKALKAACRRYQTPALLEQQFSDLDVWASLDDTDKADIAKGEFDPGRFAWSLVKRLLNLTGKDDRTLKNYRKALKGAGLL